MTGKPKIKVSQEADQFDSDNELWDSKQLGASPEHARRASPEQQKALDDVTGLHLFTFRIQKQLIEQLKELAKLDGLSYQPFMRRIISDYVQANAYKLEQPLTPNQSLEMADELFTNALALHTKITAMLPLSNERVLAETEYTRKLGQAKKHFAQVCDSGDEVVIRHAKLRLIQISELCQRDLQEDDKKYGKKRQSG